MYIHIEDKAMSNNNSQLFRMCGISKTTTARVCRCIWYLQYYCKPEITLTFKHLVEIASTGLEPNEHSAGKVFSSHE